MAGGSCVSHQKAASTVSLGPLCSPTPSSHRSGEGPECDEKYLLNAEMRDRKHQPFIEKQSVLLWDIFQKPYSVLALHTLTQPRLGYCAKGASTYGLRFLPARGL